MPRVPRARRLLGRLLIAARPADRVARQGRALRAFRARLLREAGQVRCLAAFVVATVLVTSCSDDHAGASSVSTPTTAVPTSTTAARADVTVPLTTTRSVSQNSLSCADAAATTQSLDPGATAVLGQISLAGDDGVRPLSMVSSGRDDDSQRLWTKAPLLTYGDREVALEVPEGERFWLGWGNPASPTRRMTIQGCSGASWTVFAGGFWIDSPKCVHLIVRTSGQRSNDEPWPR